MAKKDKVPVVAIRQIVKMRSDEYHNYSYRMIAEHIKNEFGIEVTTQAIGYLYRKHKDNFHNQPIQSALKEDVSSDIKLIDNKILTTTENRKKEFLDISDEDFQKMLKGE